MSKDIKNSSYASLELNELLNNYNNDRDQQVILTRNFNEIDTLPARIEGAASGGGNPHKLYNNFSKEEVVKRQKQLKKDLEADWIRNSPFYNKNSKSDVMVKDCPDGIIKTYQGYLMGFKRKLSPAQSMKEIEAFNEVH